MMGTHRRMMGTRHLAVAVFRWCRGGSAGASVPRDGSRDLPESKDSIFFLIEKDSNSFLN
jgi:hypothetical protein